TSSTINVKTNGGGQERGAPHGLGVDAALADGIGDAIDGQHISRDAIVDAVSLGEADHVLESALHDVLELLVDYRFFPEISLAVLHPLEIRRGDATRVAQDVGNHEHAFVGQNIVSGCGGGTIGAFG